MEGMLLCHPNAYFRRPARLSPHSSAQLQSFYEHCLRFTFTNAFDVSGCPYRWYVVGKAVSEKGVSI